MLIATTNELPGYVIDEVYGEGFGLQICAYGTAVRVRKV